MILMTEEQMDQFEDDMIMEDNRQSMVDDFNQSIIDKKVNELINYYDLEAKFEDISEKYEQISLFDNC